MSEIVEIAYAAASNRLCFFTGTGFSKAVTKNKAPTWQGLLEELCDLLPRGDKIKEGLFPAGKSSALSLEESAQVISIHLNSIGKNIHEEIAAIISSIPLKGKNTQVKEFFSNKSFRVITTNYDKLSEELAEGYECQSITPGLPIPKSPANIKVYHVHGSIDSPSNMVVTSDDYFQFINNNSYFSRKLSTVLYENTVVILGYSLGDTNLKAIMSDHKGFSKNHVIGSNIFLVARSSVDQHVKDYYSHCYGIRVIDDTDTEEFFNNLNEAIPKVERIVEKSITAIRKVVYEGKTFKKSYLKLEDSFAKIISSLSAEGLSLNDERVVLTIGEIIDTKRELTEEPDAWEQYVHLAKWLIHLGSIIEIRGTSIEEIYLKAVFRSMHTMSKKLVIGYSWHAYNAWKARWPSIVASNRALIKDYIHDESTDADALSIVDSI